MGGLSHLFEREGIPTASISLIRLHTETIEPPRALWVSFGLGRPFGPPNNPNFQRRVVRAALDLFGREDGPVLEDYPDDEPESEAIEENWVCPVNFSKPKEEVGGVEGIKQSLIEEISQMQPWFEQALQKRGRTTVHGNIDEHFVTAGLFAEFFGPDLPESPDSTRTLAESIRFRAEDLKAYMLESAAAQPGHPTPEQLDDWYWQDTICGKVVKDIRERCLTEDDDALRLLGNLTLVPWLRIGTLDLSEIPE